MQEAWLDELESVVGELEKGSSVEVVVAVARRSGLYRDIDFLWGAMFSFLAMGLMLLVPFDVDVLFLLPGTAVAFFLGMGVGRSRLAWSWVPLERKRKQVEDAAFAAFFREHVSATQERTGLLIYLSLDEHEVVLVPDYGVEAQIPTAVWNELRLKVREQDWSQLAGELRSVAPLLAERLPRRGDDRDELPNRPRIVA